MADEETIKKYKSMFPLNAVGAIPDPNGLSGPHQDPVNCGILIRIAYSGGWAALVPDYEGMSHYWMPGMTMPTKWVPLHEFLKELRNVYVKEHGDEQVK